MMHCMSEAQAFRDASHAFCSFLMAFTASAGTDFRSGEYSRASSSSSELKVGSLQIAISAGSFASLQSNEAAVAGLTASVAATAIRTARNIVGSPVVGAKVTSIPAAGLDARNEKDHCCGAGTRRKIREEEQYDPLPDP